MAFVTANLVGEYSTTTGTGTYSLNGTPVYGMELFDDRMASADTCYYRAKMGDDWEVGLGTFTAGTPDTLARTSIIASTNGDAAVSWGAGTKEIVLVVPASKLMTGQLIGLTVFTASGTWTRPATCKSVVVEVVGGGGGGGGCASTGVNEFAPAGGGGGGGYAMKRITSPGATETVTVGAAGAAGAAGNNNGGAGGTSSFGSHVSATGGSGGSGAQAIATQWGNTGGAGGAGASGDINTTGDIGGRAFAVGVNLTTSGQGGSSMLGGGASAVIGGQPGNAPVGGYGGGGSGAANTPNDGTARAGGAGRIGVVFVWEYE